MILDTVFTCVKGAVYKNALPFAFVISLSVYATYKENRNFTEDRSCVYEYILL